LQWEAQSEHYRFVIREYNGLFDLTVYYLQGISGSVDWFESLRAAKAHAKKEYAGLEIGRFKKIS
jgi:hypothetical protein